MRGWLPVVATAFALVACGGGGAPSGGVPTAPLTVDSATRYIGVSDGCAQLGRTCLRAPGTPGYDIVVTQPGNTAQFSAASSDPAVVEGTLVMLGPGGVGSPAIALRPHRAGRATLTIAGTGGATASVAVTVSTISTVTLDTSAYPRAATIEATVHAADPVACPSFAGGYRFRIPFTPGTGPVTIGNWPAMDASSSPACPFTSATFVVSDASNAVIATETVPITVTLGADTPATITL